MSTGTTPGRLTVLELNTPVTICMQGLWFNDLTMASISYGKISTNGDGTSSGTPGHPNGNYRMQFFDQIGWKNQAYQETLSFTHETTATDTQDIPGTWASTGASSGFLSQDAHITPSWLTGIGATTSAPGPNDQFNQKSVMAGITIAQRNAGDQASYPSVVSPGLDTPLVTMDRVFTGSSPHQPDQDMWVRLLTPKGSPYQSAQALMILYFSGMPTVLRSDGANPGNGQYTLVFWGDGTAWLMENVGLVAGQPGWVFRHNFLWSPPQNVMGALHMIHVHQDAYIDSSGNWHGSKIQVGLATTFNAIGAVVATAVDILNPQYATYNVIQYSPAQPKLIPARLDVRRDLFVNVRLQTSKYFQTGYLVTATQATPGFEPRDPLGSPTSTLLQVAFYGSFPNQLSTIKVYELASGLPLTQQGITNYPDGSVWANFVCPLNATTTETKFYAILTSQASADSQKTPIVNRCTFYRKTIGETSIPDVIEVPILSSISMSGSDRDFTHETATFVMPDPNGVLDPILTVQGGQTYRVKTYYDPLDRTKFSYLQTGRLVTAKRVTQGNKNSSYPNYGIYQATGIGEWSTLAKRVTYYVLNFGADTSGNGKPWKVTDALRALFRAAGYLDTQIDVPDLSIRFLTGNNSGNTFQLESYTPIGPVIAQYARDWLGAFVRWDPNYTNGGALDDTSGCWRVIVPPSPNGTNRDGLPGYNYLCQFLTSPPVGCAGLIYPPIISYNPDGSDMAQAPARKHSFSTTIIPPLGNCVCVTGVGQAGSILGQGTKQLQAVAHNWAAANFGQNGVADHHPLPDPTNPDWTDGIPNLIYYSDPALITQEACNFVCRRIYDFSCHAQEFVILEAPLILIAPPAGDRKWIRPRPLAFGDPVLLNGKPYFIWSAPSGKWWEGKGNQQQAMYELRSVPALTASSTHSGTDEQWRALNANVS